LAVETRELRRMTIAELLADTTGASELDPGVRSLTARGLDYDSRCIEPGFVFFAFRGARVDGAQFAAAAAERGAIAVVSEDPPPLGFAVPWITVPQGRRTLSLAARQFYPESERVTLTGITGTNGKTTTSYLIDSVIRAAGRTTALVGTIEYRIAGEIRPAVNTTPESLDLRRLLQELDACGGTHATMEVSSHALALGRARGLRFHSAIFTNLTQDHLDFHGTMDAYFEAKASLFAGQDAPPPSHAILNIDDSWARRIRLRSETQAWPFGLAAGASVRAVEIEETFSGLRFGVEYPKGSLRIESPLVGRVNVYNILAACATGLSFGFPPETIEQGIAACRAVPGRFERVDEGQPFLVLVDYAHTPDALRNVIQAARALRPSRVLTLFGCGGDRDRSKRPLMGAAAAELSDYVVLTSDNPRSEDPLAILTDALVGIRRHDTPHHAEPDRAAAIRHILTRAVDGDIVILAGKGHETYQVLKDKTIHFDDRETAREILRGFRS
jgi:UDP-N-acetylmuramoyl-L-alanyl-D-glutamate--2,6-diaminopimelate ligase